jgi:hypothetical protein
VSHPKSQYGLTIDVEERRSVLHSVKQNLAMYNSLSVDVLSPKSPVFQELVDFIGDLLHSVLPESILPEPTSEDLLHSVLPKLISPEPPCYRH